MIKRCLTAAGALLASACGFGSDEGAAEQAGLCATPTGTYGIIYQPESGTCPSVAEGLVDLTNGGPPVGTFDSACVGTSSVSANGCGFEVDATCPYVPSGPEQMQLDLHGGEPPTTRFVGTTIWDTSASFAIGDWTHTRTGPLDSCSITFNVRLRKL